MADVPFSEPDLKTLRLATPALDAERLERFMRFQRAFLQEAERPGPDRLSGAHSAAVLASGLDAGELARIAPIVADFAGRRWAMRRLARRRDELARKLAVSATLSGREQAKLQRLQAELASGSDLALLERR